MSGATKQPSWVPVFVFIGSALTMSALGSGALLVNWFVTPPGQDRVQSAEDVSRLIQASQNGGLTEEEIRSNEALTREAAEQGFMLQMDSRGVLSRYDKPTVPMAAAGGLSEMPGMLLPFQAKDYAYDHKRRRIAVAGCWPGNLAIISVDDLLDGNEEVAVTHVFIRAARTTAVAFKELPSGDVFVVGHADANGITTVDAETSEVKQTLPLDARIGFPDVIAGVVGESPNAYFVAHVNTTPTGTWQLDVEQFKLTKEWPKLVYRQLNAAVRHGEDYVTGTSEFHTPPPGPLPDPTPKLLEEWATKPEFHFVGNGTFYQAPEYVAAEAQLLSSPLGIYSLQSGEKLCANFGDPMQAFIPDTPWMAGIERRNTLALTIRSLKDGEPKAGVVLPNGSVGPGGFRHKFGGTLGDLPRVFADGKNGAFLVGSRRYITAVPLDRFELTDSDAGVAVADLRKSSATVGQEYELELLPADSKTEVKLVEGPGGMVVEDGTLRWTPAEMMLADVKLQHIVGEKSYDVASSLLVLPPQVDVDFMTLGNQPSPDGRHAVVWGHEWPERDELTLDRFPNARRERESTYERPSTSWVAVIDLSTLAVVVQREIELPIAGAAHTGSSVYVAAEHKAGGLSKSMRLLQLSAETLELIEEHRVEPAKLLGAMGERFLRFGAVKEPRIQTTIDHETHLLELPEMQKLDLTRHIPLRQGELPRVRRLAGGWLMDGVLWDERMQTPRLLLEPKGIGVAVKHIPSSGIREEAVFRGSLLFLTDRLQRSSFTRDALFSPDHFVVIDMPSRTNGLRFAIACYNPISGEVIYETPFRLSRWDQHSPFPYVSQERSFSANPAGDRVILTHYGETFVVPVPTDALDEPLRIEPQQSDLLLPLDKPHTIYYTAAKATSFRLHIPNLGIRLESPTGTFELDLQPRLAAIATSLRQGPRNSRDRVRPDKARSTASSLLDREFDGVPASVEVLVEATGPNNKKAILRHAYLVEVPTAAMSAPTESPAARAARMAARARRDPADGGDTSSKGRERRPRAPVEREATRTVAEYSGELRDRVVPAELTIAEVTQSVTAKNDRFSERFGIAKLDRTWTSTDGRSLEAEYAGIDGMTVILRNAQGRIMRVPKDRLSPADHQWLAERATQASSETTRLMTEFGKTIGRALHEHHRRAGSLPPAAIVSDEGKPLLSWRVLILHDLGYDKLARTFKYDEPWDSEHNRALVPLMPAVYAREPVKRRQGVTPFVAVVGDGTLISGQFARRLSDATDPRGETAMLVESQAEVPWTRPIDIPLAAAPRLPSLLAARDDRVMAILADAQVPVLPATTPVAEWTKLFDANDSTPLDDSTRDLLRR